MPIDSLNARAPLQDVTPVPLGFGHTVSTYYGLHVPTMWGPPVILCFLVQSQDGCIQERGSIWINDIWRSFQSAASGSAWLSQKLRK